MKLFTRNALCIMICLLIASAVRAELKPDDFAAKTFKSPDGGELPYRQREVKNPEAGKKYPLLVYFHGSASKGNDNKRQINEVCRALGRFLTDEFHRKYPCYFFTAQTQSGWARGKSMSMALALMDQSIKDYPVDPSRIYITGLSNGGVGTWTALRLRPRFFAAASPICGIGHVPSAKTFARVPIWVFHGDKDARINVEHSRNMVAALKAAGGKPRYAECPCVGHNCHPWAYPKSEFWAWIFKQRREEPRPETGH